MVNEPHQAPAIGRYRFGEIEIDGEVHRADVIVLPHGVHGGWWRREGHRLQPEDLAHVLDALPPLLVVGTGSHGRMVVDPRTEAMLAEHGIRIEAMPTPEAVAAYERRRAAGEPVAAALHLTC